MPIDVKNLAEYINQTTKGPFWLDDGLFKLYCYCLTHASRNTYPWKGILIRPGDMPLSTRHVAAALGWSRCKLDHKLKQMKETGRISIEAHSGRGTLLHIVDWPQNQATEERWPENKTTSGVNGIEIMPPLHQNQATGQYPTECRWHGDQATNPAPCREIRPLWQQNQATDQAGGLIIRPNPNRKDNHTSSSYGCQMEPIGFQEFWTSYPLSRRYQRREAAALFAQAYQDGATLDSLMAALEADKNSEDWQQENGRFIPGIVKWLQKEAWRGFVEKHEEDDPPWTSE